MRGAPPCWRGGRPEEHALSRVRPAGSRRQGAARPRPRRLRGSPGPGGYRMGLPARPPAGPAPGRAARVSPARRGRRTGARGQAPGWRGLIRGRRAGSPRSPARGSSRGLAARRAATERPRTTCSSGAPAGVPDGLRASVTRRRARDATRPRVIVLLSSAGGLGVHTLQQPDAATMRQPGAASQASQATGRAREGRDVQDERGDGRGDGPVGAGEPATVAGGARRSRGAALAAGCGVPGGEPAGAAPRLAPRGAAPSLWPGGTPSGRASGTASSRASWTPPGSRRSGSTPGTGGPRTTTSCSPWWPRTPPRTCSSSPPPTSWSSCRPTAWRPSPR